MSTEFTQLLLVLSSALLVFVLYLGKLLKNKNNQLFNLNLELQKESSKSEFNLTTIENLQTEIQSHKKEVVDQNIKIQEYLQQISTLKAEKSSLNESLEQQKLFLKESTNQLQDSFQSLASKALDGNNQQFLELAKQVLSKEQNESRSELEKRDLSLKLILDPFKETLESYKGLTQQLEVSRKEAFSQIQNELKRVSEISSTLSVTTAALKDALKKPHVRGRWGEVQLKNCIELAGMSEFCDVHFQDYKTMEDGSKLIPDMTVRMPGGRVVVVDAKTPIDAFLDSLEQPNHEAKQAQLIRHGRHVKDHIKKLSTKAYGDNLEESADFTVMFLPNESFLYAALETEADLMEFALQKKVLIATPPTLIGLLKVIRFGWNEEKLAANAQKISEAGAELHKRVSDFFDAYSDVGKSLEKARTDYETGMMRLKSRVLTQAKRLEKLGAKSNKSLPDDIEFDIDEKLIESTTETVIHS